MSKEPIILAFDPAIASIGYAVIQGLDAIAFGAIKTPSTDLPGARLQTIHADVMAIASQYRPDIVGFEQPVFYNRNTNASIVLQAFGVIRLALANTGYPNPISITQSQGKAAVGAKDKKQVEPLVRELFGIDHPIKPDDAADALAIAYAIQSGAVANVA